MIKNYFKLIVALVFVSNVMAQNVPSYVPTNGLVGWWPFNGNTNDESGNNLKTSNYTSVTFSKNRYSEENSSITISSDNNSYLEILPDAKLNSTIFTWSFWISTKNSGEQGVFSRTPIGTTCNGVTIMCLKENIAAQNLQCINSVGNYGHGSNINVADLAWHHVIFTIEPGKPAYFIIDGIKQEKGDALPLNFTVPYDQPIRIGRTTDFYWSKFIGQIDDIAIYNRVLTEQEISALYNGSNQSALASTKVFVDAPATVNQNQEVELSISTEALNTADNVIAYQTDFSYDTTRYTYVGNNLTGTLNPSGNAVVNSAKNGKLAISYMSQTALSGAGSLVKLKFKANNTLGQGVFGLSNFLYNTTTVTSLKSDTVNTIDGIPPTARITYSQNPVRKGDSLLITVNFNEKMAVSPVPQLNLTGQNTLANTNLTKVNDTTYTYWWVVEKGNGAVNVNLATGKDLGGNVIVATPTQNPSFTVLPTLFGDIDTNKLVQAYDAALALQYSVGLNPLPTMDPLPWSNWRLAVANVDTVGNVTANDASLILQHSAKLITTFPADAKKRGGDAPTANVTVTQEGNQLVFRATGTLYAFNVFMKDNFNVFGQPEVKDKSAMVASNINTTTYNVGLASTKPFIENEPFLVIPILTNDIVQGTMDIVANTEEKSLIYGKAAGIASINKEVVLVYPNPTKDVVTINNAQGKTLRIVDVQGKEVYNQKVNASSMEVSMKAIATRGEYIFQLINENNSIESTQKIILQ